MAYLVLLRWMLFEQAPAALINFDVSGQAWVSAAIVAAWHSFDAVADGPTALVTWYYAADPAAFRWDDVAAYFHALRLAAWLLNVALAVCFFGLLVVVADRGWPDLRQLWRFLRLRPMHLFGIALVADAATGGAQNLQSYALAQLGLDRLASFDLIPWRAKMHWAFAGELVGFPFCFLGFAIQGCILAEAYRRLVQLAGQEGPWVAPAS